MKRIMSIILCAALFAIMIAGCAAPPANDPANNSGDTQGTENQQPEKDTPIKTQSIDFEYQRVRAKNGPDDGYASLIVLRSLAELEAFCEENTDIRKPDFTDAVAAYNSDYFADHTLAVLSLKDGTGSTIHEINQVSKEPDGSYVVYLDWSYPEFCDTACGAWHMLVEVNDRIAEDARVTLEIIHN